MSAVDIIDGRGYILNVEFGGGKDGVDGKDGRDGVAPDLQIGTVKESEDNQPHVTISDEGDGKLSLNFDLVSGQDGQNGEDGGVFIPSVSQEGVISWIAPEGQNPPQAVSVKGETGATFTPEVSLGGEISWTNDKGLENPDTRSIKGPKGEKGDPFAIRETYSSYEAMNNDFNNPDIAEGSFVCIASDVSDPHNAELYVKGENSYVLITDLSGASGMRGPAGVSIGAVRLIETTATHKEYGVYSDQTPEVLLGSFYIPNGEDGQQGTDGVGIRSIVQTTTSHEDDGTNVITVTLTNDNTSTFTVENGSKGSTGAQGPAGQDGQDGQDGVGIDDITVEQSTFDGQANVVTVHLSDETTKTFNVYNGRTGATGTAGILHTNNSTAVSPGPGDESMSNDIRLHRISKTGNYNDLIDKPTIPAAANDSRITIQRNGTEINYFTLDQSSPKTINILVPTTVQELSDASSYAKKSDLATVATSGSYSDLSNKPIIGSAELTIRSADNATPVETYTEIGKFSANATNPVNVNLSKVARTGEYGDLRNTPENIQGSVYTDARSILDIENWPDVHSILMKRNVLFYDGQGGDGKTAFFLLLFGSSKETGKQEWNGTTGDYTKYVPLAPSRSYILEVTCSSFKLEKIVNPNDNTYVYSPDLDTKVSTVFYISVDTDSDGYITPDSNNKYVKQLQNDGSQFQIEVNPNSYNFEDVLVIESAGANKINEYDFRTLHAEENPVVMVAPETQGGSDYRLYIGYGAPEQGQNEGLCASASIRILKAFNTAISDLSDFDFIQV